MECNFRLERRIDLVQFHTINLIELILFMEPQFVLWLVEHTLRSVRLLSNSLESLPYIMIYVSILVFP
jgi:hypothetical protein